MPGVADAECVAIHANHIDMVKFPSSEDSGYQKVSEDLQFMVEESLDAIRVRWETESRIENGKD